MHDGFLKTVQRRGIKVFRNLLLAQEKSNKIYHCYIATTKDKERFDNVIDRSKIELAVNHIRQIFAKI